MKTKTELVALELLRRMFDLIWIGAAIVLVYFLYAALAKEAPWPYLSWSIVVGVIAKKIAGALKNKKQRVDYVDQLTERGYERVDAEAAWRIASSGGSNLLRNLQQAEFDDEIARVDSAICADNSEHTGD